MLRNIRPYACLLAFVLVLASINFLGPERSAADEKKGNEGGLADSNSDSNTKLPKKDPGAVVKPGVVVVEVERAQSQRSKSVRSGSSKPGSKQSRGGGLNADHSILRSEWDQAQHNICKDGVVPCIEEGILYYIIDDPPSASPTVAQIRSVAFSVAAEWKAPTPTINLGPDPETNMWQMMVVGYPMWLWTDGYTTTTSSVTRHGITVTLTGVPQRTVFDMGDGNTRACTTQPEWRPGYANKIGHCYYKYRKTSPEGGRFTITATTEWRVTWTAAGHQGVVFTTSTATTTVKVGELQAIVHNPNRYTPPPTPTTKPSTTTPTTTPGATTTPQPTRR